MYVYVYIYSIKYNFPKDTPEHEPEKNTCRKPPTEMTSYLKSKNKYHTGHTPPTLMTIKLKNITPNTHVHQ